MNAEPAAASDRLVPGMFRGPRRLDPLLPLLRRCPAPLATSLLAGLAIGEGLVRTRRRRGALDWARAQGAEGIARWQMALALLANHGRFVAQELMIGAPNLDALRRTADIRGAEHLDRLGTGAILLGFHLGPPRTALILRACGYPVHLTGRLEMVRGDSRWRKALEAMDAVRFPAGPPRGRAEGLHRIRNLLLDRAIVYLAADGRGREAFRIEVPGGSIVVRLGWFTLRRLTRVPTLPVVTYRQDGRRVIEIHPSLPDPDPDATHDAGTCQAALRPLLLDYVRRFPTQCRYAALPRWGRGDW